ncbi:MULTISPECIES: sulfotransferase family protein [unclassified Coleofasciculus]|uniref:sulfotransferase family protein n=1 Tax=unclassified Coleofasciculus TaxID=2692782 RepID=UPI001882FE82|nr:MULTISPECIES: sulfotransferase [unclassified Coleofasciculus]MBE9125329.1 sulfotransferase [Coleofasciculus sp. LEGE 07081]MBE9148532.1 sulfotransferase [Coleofasciculus sp. LEGE 07092]
MTMPNFLVIGAMKSGTTTLHNYLAQHPQVYMSPLKEPHFFSYKGQANRKITNLDDYHALFQGVSDEIAIGESSTTYLAFPKIASERIHHYIPNAKLIAILRNPSEAAYSLYLMIHRSKLTGSSKQQILDGFVQTIQNRSGNIKGRYYYGQLKQYFRLFDRDQIKIYLHEDLITEPDSLLQDIFRFLGVDEKFVIDKSIISNKGGIPKNKLLYDLIKTLKNNRTLKTLIPQSLREPIYRTYISIRNSNLEKYPQLPPEIRQQLIELYREDILKLQDLLQRDLSKWLD